MQFLNNTLITFKKDNLAVWNKVYYFCRVNLCNPAQHIQHSFLYVFVARVVCRKAYIYPSPKGLALLLPATPLLQT